MYLAALRGFRDAGTPFDEALTCLDMAALLGPREPDVEAASARALEVFAELRAAPLIAQLDAALGRGPAASAGSSAAPAEREAQVVASAELQRPRG